MDFSQTAERSEGCLANARQDKERGKRSEGCLANARQDKKNARQDKKNARQDKRKGRSVGQQKCSFSKTE